MSKRESLVRYQHMLDNARKAMSLVKGKSRKFLDQDWVTTLALVRLIEIIGEAANRVPLEEQSKHSEIPWMEIIGMRNRLIHGYDAIDLEILWQVLQKDLPPLTRSLEKIVKELT